MEILKFPYPGLTLKGYRGKKQRIASVIEQGTPMFLDSDKILERISPKTNV